MSDRYRHRYLLSRRGSLRLRLCLLRSHECTLTLKPLVDHQLLGKGKGKGKQYKGWKTGDMLAEYILTRHVLAKYPLTGYTLTGCILTRYILVLMSTSHGVTSLQGKLVS